MHRMDRASRTRCAPNTRNSQGNSDRNSSALQVAARPRSIGETSAGVTFRRCPTERTRGSHCGGTASRCARGRIAALGAPNGQSPRLRFVSQLERVASCGLPALAWGDIRACGAAPLMRACCATRPCSAIRAPDSREPVATLELIGLESVRAPDARARSRIRLAARTSRYFSGSARLVAETIPRFTSRGGRSRATIHALCASSAGACSRALVRSGSDRGDRVTRDFLDQLQQLLAVDRLREVALEA